jgi:hypothetical protein
VTVADDDGTLIPGDQPFFYIYPNIAFTDVDDFLVDLGSSLARRRAN